MLLTLAYCSLQVPNIQGQSAFHSQLPLSPKTGMTIGGVVECDGNPVENVTVSDGFVTTTTDSHGQYWLRSDKKNPYVFVVKPSGFSFTPNQGDAVAPFWANLEKAASQFERHDFSLTPANESKSSILLTSDIHLHGKLDDIDTFMKYANILSQLSDSISSAGNNVMSISLGDMSYDRFWRETGIDIERTKEIISDSGFPSPLFTIMGNHDSDPAICAGDSTDFRAALRYMHTYGPRYYSLNIGEAHIVMLDNIIYKNTPVKESPFKGIPGKTDYRSAITPEQIEWLKSDLAGLSHENPILICTHAPVVTNVGNGIPPTISGDRGSAEALLRLTSPFKNIYFLSGHTHRNAVSYCEAEGKSITARNLVSLCGSIWWNTAHGQPNMGHDGSPAGFDILNIRGKEVTRRFIALDHSPDESFSVWSTASLKHLFSGNPDVATFLSHYPEWGDYSYLPDNSVIVYIWDDDPRNSVTISENGKPLRTEIISVPHPDYYLYTAISKTVGTGDFKKAFAKPRKIKMLLATASSPDSIVTVTCTSASGTTDSRIFAIGK